VGGVVRGHRGRRTKGRKGVEYHHNEPIAPWALTNELDDVEDSALGPKRVSSSPLNKRRGNYAGKSEQRDPENSSDSSDDDDMYEGSGSDGNPVGEGQYGKVLACLYGK
jgi:hypothetical protein